MDYPQLNLLAALALVLANTVSVGLAVLLSKAHLPVYLPRASWAAAAASLLPAVYAGSLFAQNMLPAVNRQLALGILVIGGLGALATAGIHRLAISPRAAWILLSLQLLSDLLGIAIAFGLYRSLAPIAAVGE